MNSKKCPNNPRNSRKIKQKFKAEKKNRMEDLSHNMSIITINANSSDI